MNLAPKAGFDWSRVVWGAPDAQPTAVCSYCFGALDAAPLILWREDGAACQFCRECQRRWWGLVSFDDDPDDDE